MTPVGGKTRLLNWFRAFFQIPALERLLLGFVSGRHSSHPLSKLTPNHYQYPSGSIRHAVRGGLSYRLDISDFIDWFVYFGFSDPSRDRLYALVRPGDIVFDVGTNMGETLLNFARLSGPSGRVFGFEPEPKNYSRCMENVRLNALSNVTMANVGLARLPGTARMTVNDAHNQGMNSISRDPAAGSVSVNLQTMDAVVLEHRLGKVDLVKIDVEGFEWEVLSGGTGCIAQFRPKLFIEVDDGYLLRQGSSAKEVVAFLEGLGYTITDAATSEQVHSRRNFENCHFDALCVP